MGNISHTLRNCIRRFEINYSDLITKNKVGRHAHICSNSLKHFAMKQNLDEPKDEKWIHF